MNNSTWITHAAIIVTSAGAVSMLSSSSTGYGGSCGSTIHIDVEANCCSSPSSALEDDIVIKSYTSDQGEQFDQFIFASSVTGVEYEGTADKLRSITGHQCTLGTPGVFPIQDEDGDGSSVSEVDKTLFAARILDTWSTPNINAYIHRRTNAHFSCTVEFEEDIFDNSPFSDLAGELLVFEISGNSWVQIEALDDDGEIMGTPLVVGNYSKIAPNNLYTRKYSNNGSPLCGAYEIKAIAVDLSDLGVNRVRTLRVRSPENPPGGGDIKACFRVIGVKTSTLPTTSMVFD